MATTLDLHTVYRVYHAYEYAPGCDEMKQIGFFSTLDEAESIVKKLAVQPGFRDHVDGFHIEATRIGDVKWADGFIPVQ